MMTMNTEKIKAGTKVVVVNGGSSFFNQTGTVLMEKKLLNEAVLWEVKMDNQIHNKTQIVSFLSREIQPVSRHKHLF